MAKQSSPSPTSSAVVTTPPEPAAASILIRKLDLVYLIFFLTHVPVMLRIAPFHIPYPIPLTFPGTAAPGYDDPKI